jgi:hypothetical protein
MKPNKEEKESTPLTAGGAGLITLKMLAHQLPT